MKSIHLIALFALLLFASCEKVLVEPTQESTPTAIFEQTWSNLDQKYTFFSYRKINWDSIGNVYRSKVTDNISNDSLFNVLDKMLYTLKDGHVNLLSSENRSRNWQWYLDYPPNFDQAILERNYWGNWKTTGPFEHQLIKGVGYVRYESFSSGIAAAHLNHIIDTYKDAKGLIIDVRNNGGGATGNVFAILERLTDKKMLVGKVATKNGPKHDDFTVPKEAYISPSADSKKYLDKKVVILANRFCYSSANLFVAFAKAIPNITVVGDTSGGGGGIPTSIQLSNGWMLRYSSTITTDAKGFNIEDGIAPNIKIDMSKADIDKGKDSILEKALSLF
jgi:Peptidase family S41/Tricorn protease C1 domain